MWSEQCSSFLSWMELRETRSQSLSQSENFDNKVDDPYFVLDEEREEAAPPICTQTATQRSAQGRDCCGRSMLAQAAETLLSCEPWKTEEDADTAPAISRFQPRRTPVQLGTLSPYSPKDLSFCFLPLTQSGQSQATLTNRLQKTEN